MNANPNRTPVYFDVIEACGEAGCPLCRLSRRASERYVDAVLYEMVNDAKVQADFGAARGYCQRHARLMPKGRGRSLGVALLQRTALLAVLQVLDEVGYRAPSNIVQRVLSGDVDAGASPATRRLIAALEPQIECPVCQAEADLERIALEALLDHLNDPGMAHAFERSAGLCLPHFRRALARVSDESTFVRLVQMQRAHLERLRDELSEFIRKNDYRYAAEGYGAEGDSWLRAVGIVSGQSGEP